MDNFFKTIGKYWFPALCIAAGIAILVAASGPNAQPQEVYLGAACILLVGIASLLFLMDLIKKPVQMVLSIVFLAAAAWLFFANTNSINSEIAYQEKAKLLKAQTIQALKDVRSAEQAYYQVNKTYTQNLDELVSFVKNGTVPKLKKIGAIPDSVGTEAKAIELGLIQKMPEGMTDAEVSAAGIIVRDTIQISVMEDKFTNDHAMKSRKFDFNVDKMKFAPNSGNPWGIKAGKINIGGVDQAVLEVVDPEPFAGEALKIGSMEDAHLNGNWKED